MDAPDPLFTVIITTHNRKDMLPRAIRSVLGQTFDDFELLVIDNGSSDGTQAAVEGIKDSRLKYFRSPNPTDSCDGPRNIGIEMARGRYTAFLDDDDIWYPTRLEKVQKVFADRPELSAVCHNENRIVDGEKAGEIKYKPASDDMYDVLLYEGNCLSSCGTTVRTELLRRLGGFDLRKEFSGAADYEFWIRMAASGANIGFIDEPLGEFTVTGRNFSLKDASYGFKIASIARMHILAYEGRRMLNISTGGMARLFKLYAIAGRSYLRARDYAHGTRCLALAMLFLLIRPMILKTLFTKTGR